MLRAFKTEVELTGQQKQIFARTVGVMRYVKNLYIKRNQEIYQSEHRFITAYEFSVWLNNEYPAANPDKQWIKGVYQKAVADWYARNYTSFEMSCSSVCFVRISFSLWSTEKRISET